MQKNSIICIICIICMTACGKETVKETIPWAEVNFRVDVRNQDNHLSASGNSLTFTQPRLATDRVGFSGLLVFASPYFVDGTTFNRLYAFDLCCPYERMKNTTVAMQGDGTAKCKQCGSVYDVINGTGQRLSGPTEKGLQVYACSYSSSDPGVFYIHR